jgi:hypothetical protein
VFVCLCPILQIEGLLGKKLDSIYAGNASALRVLSVVGPEGFELRNRALHVYSEAGRVYAFRDVCKVRGLVLLQCTAWHIVEFNQVSWCVHPKHKSSPRCCLFLTAMLCGAVCRVMLPMMRSCSSLVSC